MRTTPPQPFRPARWLPRPSPDHIRHPDLSLTPAKAYALVAVMWAMSGGYSLAQAAAGITGLTATTSHAGIVLAMVLLVLVARGEGTSADTVGILPAWPKAAPPRKRWVAQWWTTTAYTALALLSGIGLYAVMAAALPSAWTATSVSWFALRMPFLHLVTVGAVVVLLGAARRPAREVYTVAALSTAAVFVVPFGIGSLAAGPPALALVWLYRRTRRLTALVVAEAVVLCTVLLTAALP